MCTIAQQSSALTEGLAQKYLFISIVLQLPHFVYAPKKSNNGTSSVLRNETEEDIDRMLDQSLENRRAEEEGAAYIPPDAVYTLGNQEINLNYITEYTFTFCISSDGNINITAAYEPETMEDQILYSNAVDNNFFSRLGLARSCAENPDSNIPEEPVPIVRNVEQILTQAIYQFSRGATVLDRREHLGLQYRQSDGNVTGVVDCSSSPEYQEQERLEAV